jgi:hypothetical protein
MEMKIVYVFVAILATACSSAGFYKSSSSGQIGCPEDQIEISDVSSQLRGQTWIAACKGRRFYCNSTSSSGFGSNQITCKEELK